MNLQGSESRLIKEIRIWIYCQSDHITIDTNISQFYPEGFHYISDAFRIKQSS